MGVAPRYQLSDFVRSFQMLMPRGRVWPREASATQSKAIAAILPTHKRQADAAANEIEDNFPRSTVTKLGDWELALGLPDPCAGEDPTIAQRQAHVAARMGYRGGQSVPYFEGFAATIGFPVTILEFAPARAGKMRAGDPCNSTDWAFTWRVVAPSIGVDYFRASEGRAGDPLAIFSNTVLGCELRRIKPAHTVLQLSFGGVVSGDGSGGHRITLGVPVISISAGVLSVVSSLDYAPDFSGDFV